jgi:hypothetical protein
MVPLIQGELPYINASPSYGGNHQIRPWDIREKMNGTIPILLVQLTCTGSKITDCSLGTTGANVAMIWIITRRVRMYRPRALAPRLAVAQMLRRVLQCARYALGRYAVLLARSLRPLGWVPFPWASEALKQAPEAQYLRTEGICTHIESTEPLNVIDREISYAVFSRARKKIETENPKQETRSTDHET